MKRVTYRISGCPPCLETVEEEYDSLQGENDGDNQVDKEASGQESPTPRSNANFKEDQASSRANEGNANYY